MAGARAGAKVGCVVVMSRLSAKAALCVHQYPFNARQVVTEQIFNRQIIRCSIKINADLCHLWR